MHVKTLAEIAIEAGLVTKAGAVKAGRLAEERKMPLVAVLVRELGVDEVVDKGYKQFSTAVVSRPRPFGDSLFVTTKNNRPSSAIEGAASSGEGEVSVTAQIPLSSLREPPDLDARFKALCQVLVNKGIVTEAELLEALGKKET